MNVEEYEKMYRLEESYWWFVGRHDLVLGFMNRLYRGRSDLSILDIGCGTGAMSRKLDRFGVVISADFSPLALEFGKRRELRRLCASDAMRLPFQSRSFDVVVALDVLEHVQDDRAALSEFHRVLKPNGRVIATVPAYPSLWSGHDVALMHFRRYVASEVRERFQAARFRIEKLTYAMTLLYPLVWVARRLSRRRDGPPRSSLVSVPRTINRILVGLLAGENRLLRRIGLPFGVTVLCIAVAEGEVRR